MIIKKGYNKYKIGNKRELLFNVESSYKFYNNEFYSILVRSNGKPAVLRCRKCGEIKYISERSNYHDYKPVCKNCKHIEQGKIYKSILDSKNKGYKYIDYETRWDGGTRGTYITIECSKGHIDEMCIKNWEGELCKTCAMEELQARCIEYKEDAMRLGNYVNTKHLYPSKYETVDYTHLLCGHNKSSKLALLLKKTHCSTCLKVLKSTQDKQSKSNLNVIKEIAKLKSKVDFNDLNPITAVICGLVDDWLNCIKLNMDIYSENSVLKVLNDNKLVELLPTIIEELNGLLDK